MVYSDGMQCHESTVSYYANHHFNCQILFIGLLQWTISTNLPCMVKKLYPYAYCYNMAVILDCFFKMEIFRRLPFDWKTPVGYAGCTFIEISIIYAMSEVFSVISALTVGLCYFASSFVSDLEENLFRLEMNMNVAADRSFTAQQIIELKKKLTDFIVFLGEAREYGLNFRSLIKP